MAGRAVAKKSKLEDSSRWERGGHGHPHEEQQVVDYFWRDGFVPRWIDVSLFSTNGTITVFELRASDVFTRYEADDDGRPDLAARQVGERNRKKDHIISGEAH